MRRMHPCGIKFVSGVSFIELIIFIVVINIALVAVLQIYGQAVVNSVDPIIRIRATELARATLDDVLTRRFDEATPSGGVPACDSASAAACIGIAADSDFDDVGDFDGYSDTRFTGYPISVVVAHAGSDLGISNTAAKKITVTVGMPDGNEVRLAAYKANF